MLVRLSKNSFVRIIDNGAYGYIFNQLSFHDRCYLHAGVDMLSVLSRNAQDQDQLANEIISLYPSADPAKVCADFTEMMNSLAKAKFIVQGNTIQELDEKDTEFSYRLENPKTLIEDYSQMTEEVVFENTEAFQLRHDSNKPRLSSIQFELTGKCNERCIHCYIPNPKKDNGKTMSLELVKNIIDQFEALGGLHVTLSGGEALLHPRIKDILRYCRYKDLQISLLSNLINLTDDLVKVLKEVNMSIVQTSLYSMEHEIHDYITTIPGSWEKTMEAIKKLHAADVPVQISCPVMKANAKGYKNVMKFAKSLKMKSQTDYIMMAQSDQNTQNLANRISLDETENLIHDIVNQDSDYQRLLEEVKPESSLPLLERSEMPVCGVGLNQICVAANGDFFPCAGWQEMIVGNISENSLKEIWFNSPQLNNLRKIKRKDFPKCFNCEAGDYCVMCMARNYNESGDIFMPPTHTCEVASLNKRIAEERLNIKK